MSVMGACENHETAATFQNMEIKLYPKRWFLLMLFMLYACNVALPWFQFASIANIVSQYYKVSQTLIEWTSISVMAGRTFFIVPALFLMERLEIKHTLLLASTLCFIGSCVKIFSISPDGFYIAMSGQVFSALALVSTYSLIGRFSAAWFGADEISKAGALCCAGEVMGVGFSFLLPTRLVPHSQKIEEIEKGMRNMHYCYAGLEFLTLILIMILFQSQPKHPPSAAQLHTRSIRGQQVCNCAKELLRKRNFILFVLSQSIIVGSGCNALSTLLNHMIVVNFPDHTEHTGTIGCLNLLSGIIGSVIFSYIQDGSRKFKSMAIALSFANCITVLLFTISLKMDNIIYVYITFALNGFLVQGYYATSIQMGIELSFPLPEGITVATMSVCVELVSMISTALYGIAMRRYGDWETNICVTLLLLFSTIIVCLVPPKFGREELEKAVKLQVVKVC